MGITAQLGESILETYKQSELHSLCDACGVPLTGSTKKENFANSLHIQSTAVTGCHSQLTYPEDLELFAWAKRMV